MTRLDVSPRILRVSGVPNSRQKAFFSSRARYTAYGGARGGGKSWALRRKLIAAGATADVLTPENLTLAFNRA